MIERVWVSLVLLFVFLTRRRTRFCAKSVTVTLTSGEKKSAEDRPVACAQDLKHMAQD